MTTEQDCEYTDNDLKAALAKVEFQALGRTWVNMAAVYKLQGKQEAAFLAYWQPILRKWRLQIYRQRPEV